MERSDTGSSLGIILGKSFWRRRLVAPVPFELATLLRDPFDSAELVLPVPSERVGPRVQRPEGVGVGPVVAGPPDPPDSHQVNVPLHLEVLGDRWLLEPQRLGNLTHRLLPRRQVGENPATPRFGDGVEDIRGRSSPRHRPKILTHMGICQTESVGARVGGRGGWRSGPAPTPWPAPVGVLLPHEELPHRDQRDVCITLNDLLDLLDRRDLFPFVVLHHFSIELEDLLPVEVSHVLALDLTELGGIRASDEAPVQLAQPLPGACLSESLPVKGIVGHCAPPSLP